MIFLSLVLLHICVLLLQRKFFTRIDRCIAQGVASFVVSTQFIAITILPFIVSRRRCCYRQMYNRAAIINYLQPLTCFVTFQLRLACLESESNRVYFNETEEEANSSFTEWNFNTPFPNELNESSSTEGSPIVRDRGDRNCDFIFSALVSEVSYYYIVLSSFLLYC